MAELGTQVLVGSNGRRKANFCQAVTHYLGKQFVYSHHLSVPFLELEVDTGKSLHVEGQKLSLDAG